MVVEGDVLGVDGLAGAAGLLGPDPGQRSAAQALVAGIAVGEGDELHGVAELDVAGHRPP